MNTEQVNLVVHIDEEMSDAEIEMLERGLAQQPGVTAACVNDRHRHLMVVDYDPEDASSMAILSGVQQRGYHAELIGF